jgi:sarcosine oxidase subunit alpha
VLAAGAFERPLVFSGNDRPGVMLAGAARTYVNRYAARPGQRAVIVAAGDEGPCTAADLQRAGIEVAAVLDRRDGGHITHTRGRHGLRAVHLISAQGRRRRVEADLLCMAGGWSPNLALACQMNNRPRWDADRHAFVPDTTPPGMVVAGAAAGRFALAECLADGARLGAEAAAGCGHDAHPGPAPQATREPVLNASVLNAPIWLMPRGAQKAFVDFQHDVTAGDIALSHREGFRSVEHLKRYTTLGMATDQGKLSNVTGLAIMAALTGRGIADTGTTMFRPPYTPVTIGALAGHSVGQDFRPTRMIPAHDVAVEQGAEFMNAGAWVRPAFFPRPGEDWLAASDREALAVRTAVGVCDVSTLGKIELVGADVGAFLDRLYTNTFSTLKPGRVRYGLMLREDGFVMDDGTSARLEEERWVLTTTTAQAAPVLAHMEFCHQVLWPELDVQFTTVTDQWAQFSLAGPQARAVLAAVLEGDVGDAAIPYMACAVLRFARVPARVFRISFSGEMAFEIAVPAGHGSALLRALTAAGQPHGLVPYGIEALNVLRIEKGHPAGSELNGTVTGRDLGLGKMMSTRKDYIGRALALRPALIDPERPTLVGLRPTAPGQRLRGGAHLLTAGVPPAIEHDQGWVTSGAHSPVLGGWIALGFVRNGPARIGERLRVYDPIRSGAPAAEAEIVPPCFYDPEGVRLRG